jgi:hypothetical protein
MNDKLKNVKTLKTTTIDEFSEEISVKTINATKVYRIHYLPDDEKRKEAIHFFSSKRKNSLFPDLFNLIPNEVSGMSVEEGNIYLASHPQKRNWFSLQLDTDQIKDYDLHRLEYLPELKHIMIYSNSITDNGIFYLKHLKELQRLLLYSANVSDHCTSTLKELSSLRTLDLQGSPNISYSAYNEVINCLPNLEDVYPPSREELKNNIILSKNVNGQTYTIEISENFKKIVCKKEDGITNICYKSINNKDFEIDVSGQRTDTKSRSGINETEENIFKELLTRYCKKKNIKVAFNFTKRSDF